MARRRSRRKPRRWGKPHLDFTYRQKKEMYARDGGICRICQKPVTFKMATFHHIVPAYKSNRLAQVMSNGVTLHKLCHIRHFQELHGFKPKKSWVRSALRSAMRHAS